jgi:hypothetical protein
MSPRNLKLNPQIDGRLAAYAAVAGAALAAPAIPQADATIIYSGVVNINIPSTTAGIYLNVATGQSGGNTVPGWNLNPWGSGFLDMFNPSNESSGAYVGDGTGYFNLAPGTLIGPSSTYTSGANSPSFPLNLNSSNNLIGFVFVNSVTSTTDYGWMRISLGATSGAQPRMIVDYAYDDSGAPIMAGQVPEPSTLALLGVMAAGAMGVRAWRKSKNS